VGEFSVFQSIWGMVDLPREGRPWSIAEKLDQIRAGGFAGVDFDQGLAVGEAEHLGRMARDRGLRVSINMVAGEREAVRRAYDWAMIHQPEHISIQPFGAYLDFERARDRLAMMIEVGHDYGLAPTIETHRDRLTQSLAQTVALARAIPELRFTVDLSHHVCAAEWAWNDRMQFEQMIQVILGQAGHFHGRVSNGEQIQIDIGDGSESPDASKFKAWWIDGMRMWRAGDGRPEEARLRFVVELGPYPYASRAVTRTGRPNGPEHSDRWAQALVLKRIAEECWRESAM
jgi:hypothetical protein